MTEGKIVLVNLSKGKLAEDSSNFLGSLIVAMLAVAIFQRSHDAPEKRRPAHVHIDEFQSFTTSSLPLLLSEAGKYKVDFVIAHQFRDQLRPWVQGATSATGNLICFRLSGEDGLEMAREFDCTPPLAEFEFRQRFRPRLGEGARVLRDNGKAAIDVLKRIRGGESVSAHEQVVARKWLSTYSIWSRKPRVKAAFQRMAKSEPLEVTDKWIKKLEKAHGQLEARDEDDFDTFVQDRTVYPQTPGTFHFNYPPDGGRGESVSSEIGARYEMAAGRSRMYSDVFQEIANELSRLPKYHAKSVLVSPTGVPEEANFKTLDWPAVRVDDAETQIRLDRIRCRTRRLYCRPREEVEAELAQRYSLRLEAVGLPPLETGDPLPEIDRYYEADEPDD